MKKRNRTYNPHQKYSKGPSDAFLGKPLEVRLRKDETADRLIKRFMKKVRNDGVLNEFLERRFFEKPSTIRRRKREMSIWNEKNRVKK